MPEQAPRVTARSGSAVLDTSGDPLLAELRAAIGRWQGLPERPSFVVAFSGGIDSTVLLAALARLGMHAALRAVHVDHGLHPDSAAWGERCAATAAALGVPCTVARVTVERASGLGLEAAARDARYGALRESLRSGELLLTAHHADDQLETVLLRLLRGAGVRGMRGIGELAPFGRGWLGRPLLACTRAELHAQAAAWRLDWLDDPANEDPRHDRNFLRARVVPQLLTRWPAAARAAVRFALAAADAEAILEAVADEDLRRLDDARRIPRAALAALAAPRQRNLLREALRRAELPPPSAAKLDELRRALLDARPGAARCVRWPGAEGRVFRERLYLMPPLAPPSAPGVVATLGCDSVWIGPEGRLSFERAADASGLPESWLDAGVELRFRAGGEHFQPQGRDRGRPLKDWMHDAAIVPWMRGRVPLLYRGEQLVAVADLAYGAAVTAAGDGEPRWSVRWSGHPWTQ